MRSNGTVRVTRSTTTSGEASLYTGNLPEHKRRRLDSPEGAPSARARHAAPGDSTAASESAVNLPPRQPLVLLQALVRGHLQRQKVLVQSVAPGIVHTSIRGAPEVFDSVGMGGIQSGSSPKSLDILSVRGDKFEPHLVGGDSKRTNLTLDPEKDLQSFGFLLGKLKFPQGLPCAYINGGYYNSKGLADKNKPTYTPIGETATVGGKTVPSLPVPADYADRYATVTFADGSKLTSGPVLVKDRGVRVTEEDLQDPKFRFQDEVIRPGELHHAEHPNPRCSITMPAQEDTGGSYRIAFGNGLENSTARGAAGPGYTMAEWARVSLRLDAMNDKAGMSLNLDGGATATLGVIGSETQTLLERKFTQDDAYVSTMVVLARRNDSGP